MYIQAKSGKGEHLTPHPDTIRRHKHYGGTSLTFMGLG